MIKPLSTTIYNKAIELGITSIVLRFEGGNDEAYISVGVEPSNSDFENEIEEWAHQTFDYSGAGDGNDYGDDITYNLTDMTVSHSEWCMERSDTHYDSVDLPLEETIEEREHKQLRAESPNENT